MAVAAILHLPERVDRRRSRTDRAGALGHHLGEAGSVRIPLLGDDPADKVSLREDALETYDPLDFRIWRADSRRRAVTCTARPRKDCPIPLTIWTESPWQES